MPAVVHQVLHMTSRRILAILWIVVVLVTLGLQAANLFLGDLNQDEGWYLYAARLVSEGSLPYVDFATTQGPVMPFVYALADPLVRLWGLAGGRLFTAVIGLVCCVLTALTAARLSRCHRQWAALMAFALVGVNVYQSYYFTVVKTYALAGCLLMAGFLALTFAEGRRGAVAAMLAGVFFGLAGATRTSAILAAPAGFLYLAGAWRKTDVLRAFWLAIGTGLAVATVMVPFAWTAPDAFWFALWEYHAGRLVGSLPVLLAYKAAFVSRQIQAYFAASALLVSAAILSLLRERQPGNAGGSVEAWYSRPATALWLSVLLITAVHWVAPFPYDDYQVIVFPVLVAALASWLPGLADSLSGGTQQGRGLTVQAALAGMVVVITLMTAVSSPMNQEWFAGKRDRIWWPLKDETPLKKLQRTAHLVQSLTAPGDMLLTQDPYLAVEADRGIPHGLELGQFSYFPDWPRDKAERCHVLNGEMMRDLIGGARAPLAVFSEYGFAIKSPSVTPLSTEEQAQLWGLLAKRYSLFREIPDFGQAATRLRIMLLAE